MLGRVTVIGCGLIGGSVVKRLWAREAARSLSAVDCEEVLALARPYLDGAALPGSDQAAELVAKSDLIVLATPVGSIVRDMGWVLDAAVPGAVVTDTGSVKKPIVDAAARHVNGSSFVGGHPMAGREVGGFDASSPDLFERTRWFLVEGAPGAAGEGHADQGARARAIARVMDLARVLGAEPTIVDPEVHDRAMAYVSHAPQLVASALYVVAARAGVLTEAGSGFRDVTRIAGGPLSMWRDIFAGNRTWIAATLGEISESLARVRDALAEGGESGIVAALALLEEAQTARQAMLSDEPPARGSS
jgi:prephenate dehydrogenase